MLSDQPCQFLRFHVFGAQFGEIGCCFTPCIGIPNTLAIHNEAESFSTYSVQCVQEALEEFGCKIRKIECKAEEADMTWLDRLEDAIFGPKDKAQKQSPAKDKSGQKTASKKKAPRQER